MDQKNGLKGGIQVENESGRLSQQDIERMLNDAEQYKQEDTLTREENIARESLKGYMVRLRKAMGDLGDKMSQKDGEMMEAKFADTMKWLTDTGDKSTKQECEEKFKLVEAAWNIIMVRVSRSLDDFWDKQVEVAREIVYVEDGGFHVKTGFDLRELMDDPD
mmetsp:Transcript_1381/g.2723  ORF Transcript_1381/g.2723 Transcript_1381/m.2723 type:complete len:162 (-) Transcript_1381:47-532(-)